MNQLLMIPGPTEIDPAVLKEMNTPMVAHYGAKWTEYYDETRKMLQEIMGTEEDLFLFVGSGHAALDAAIGSLVEEDDKILVLSNGAFGERIAEIVASYRAKPVKITTAWGKAFKPEEIDKYLQSNQQQFKAMLMVHNETSTGVTNPVDRLCEIAKKYGLVTFVDGVCSVGITEFKMKKWSIDIAVTASQKGLGAPPGLAVVAVRENGWRAIEERKKRVVGWYLNLTTMREFNEKQKGFQPYSITMAVNNVRALNKSLKMIKEEGLVNRIKRHTESAKFFRNKIKELGLEVAASEEDACCAVTVINNPDGYNSEELIKLMDEEYNIRIANGLGKFAGHAIRVGHMNLGASKTKLYPVICALEEIIKAD